MASSTSFPGNDAVVIELIRIMRLIVIILTLFCLSSCMDAQCIDADDFGFAKFTISAKQDKKNTFGEVDNQVSKWSNTGYSLTGKPLVIVVKNWSYKENGNVEGTLSAWCPWYGSNSGASAIGSFFDPMIPPFPNALSYMSQGMALCKWRNPNDMCATTRAGDADVTNAPCLFTKGVGLYALLTSQGYNPNLTVNNMRDPSGTAIAAGRNAIAIHVGDPNNQISSGYSLYDINSKGEQEKAGGVVYNDVTPYLNGGLYFKILDKHYGDNSGQYLVIVKSGLDYNVPDPIQFITNLVATYFFGNDAFLGNKDDDAHNQVKAIVTSPSNKGLIETLYVALIQNPYYKNIVRGSLSLYIVLTGLYYLAGLLRITRAELMKRVIKIIIVSVLLDPNLGWKFFHDYLFVFFIEGVQFLISTIQSAATSGPGSSSVLALMMAPETLVKLASLLFTTWIGIFYIILYLLIFIFLWSVIFKAAVLYLNCLIMIGMIIILGPVFLSFILFSVTQSLYENWLKQLISYSIQPIILITIIAFMSMLVRHEIYTTLGFPVCKFNFPQISDGGMGLNNIFYWWMPSPNPLSGKGFANSMDVIPVPEAHMQLDSNGNATNVFCDSYECFENRYTQLPFLDPNNPVDMNKKSKFFGGSFAQTDSLLLLIILIYLLNKATMSAEVVAKAIAETSSNSTSLPEASMPHIPYDSPSSSGGGGESKGGGEGGDAPRPNIIKNDPLALDSGSVGKSSKDAPLLLTGGAAPPPSALLILPPSPNVIKPGSKDDSFLPYDKAKIPLSKRSMDDMDIGKVKVTIDFKAEAAKAKKKLDPAKDLIVKRPPSVFTPVLQSMEPVSLSGSVTASSESLASTVIKPVIEADLGVRLDGVIKEESISLLPAKDLVIKRPKVSTRPNLSASVTEGPKVNLSESKVFEMSISDILDSPKPVTREKPVVIFESVVEKSPHLKASSNIALNTNVFDSVTSDFAERPNSISFEKSIKELVLTTETITIEDTIGNKASFDAKSALEAPAAPKPSGKGQKTRKSLGYGHIGSRVEEHTKKWVGRKRQEILELQGKNTTSSGPNSKNPKK